MTELATYKEENGVAVIAMQHGKVNALSPALIDAINAALDQAEAASLPVVLTGQPGIFSAGFDLDIMKGGDMTAVLGMIGGGRDLGIRLLTFPAPVVMAASGHAMAMGFLLLCCGDYVLAADRDIKFGLNEVAIGMTMPSFGIELTKSRMTAQTAFRAVTQAEPLGAAKALESGLADELCPANTLLDSAISKARTMNQMLNRAAFVATRNKYRQDMVDRLRNSDDFNPAG